jgi:branched-subunit amino acid transport protein
VNDTFYVLSVVAGLTLISVVNRSFFFIPRRELPLPGVLKRGLRYAPLAALMGVIAPELMALDSAAPWQDARPWAALVAACYGVMRRGIFGTILVGMSVLWALKFGLGW